MQRKTISKQNGSCVKKHVIIEPGCIFNNYFVETKDGRIKVKYIEEEPFIKCDRCTIERRKCPLKNKKGKDRFHYVWMCEEHITDQCPLHGLELTNEIIPHKGLMDIPKYEDC